MSLAVEVREPTLCKTFVFFTSPSMKTSYHTPAHTSFLNFIPLRPQEEIARISEGTESEPKVRSSGLPGLI
jgi:hypothetical protein